MKTLGQIVDEAIALHAKYYPESEPYNVTVSESDALDRGGHRLYNVSLQSRFFSGSREMSAKSRPANVTERDSGRRRFPWQSGHALLNMKADTRFFISGLSVFANVLIT